MSYEAEIPISELENQYNTWVNQWWLGHNDYFHPGTRDDCSHCQEMIRLFGEMPSQEEFEIFEREKRHLIHFDVYVKEPISMNLRRMIFQRDNFTCLHCGTQEHLTIDHIFPESRGGKAVPENLQTLCRSCNSRKGVKCEY